MESSCLTNSSSNVVLGQLTYTHRSYSDFCVFVLFFYIICNSCNNITFSILKTLTLQVNIRLTLQVNFKNINFKNIRVQVSLNRCKYCMVHSNLLRFAFFNISQIFAFLGIRRPFCEQKAVGVS